MEAITAERVRELYRAAVVADEAWTEQIRKQFPRERVGDVRYTDRGKGDFGTPLRAAHDLFTAAIKEWQAAVDARRKQGA